MDFIVEYLLPETNEPRKVVIRDCANVDDALKQFKQEYGAQLTERVISVFPTNL